MVGIVSSLFGEIPNNYVVCSRTYVELASYRVCVAAKYVTYVRGMY